VRLGLQGGRASADVGGSGGATKRTDGRCRFDDIDGRRRFMEGRTRGGSLPLRALIGSIDYLFYIELLLYSKVVTFDPVP
jgi:hypothetical protein